MKRAVVYFFALLGLIMVVISGWNAFTVFGFLRQAEEAPGTVIDAGAGGVHARIQFTTKAGQIVAFQQGGLVLPVKAGSVVSIRYRSESPMLTARLERVDSLWFVPVLLSLIGFAFLVLALSNFRGT